MSGPKRSRGNIQHTSCTQARRMLQHHYTINVHTGESTDKGAQWIERACGTPLFTDAEKSSGKCRACASGWTHENNYPIDEVK